MMYNKLLSKIKTLFSQIISAVSGASTEAATGADQSKNSRFNKVSAGQITFFFYDSKNIVL